MPTDPTVRELRDRIDRLENEVSSQKAEHGTTTAPPQAPPEQKPDQPQQKPDPQPAKDGGAPQNQEGNKPPAPKKRPLRQRARRYIRRHPGRLLLGAIVLVLLAVGGYFLWTYLQSYEDTDDAQVDGHLNPIGPRIAGTVVGVYVENNDMVKPGQLVVDLDPRDYKAALERATGAYQQAVAQLHAENPSVPITITTTQTSISVGQADVDVADKAVAAAQHEYQARLADLRSAEAQNAKAQTDVKRYQPLVDKAEISQQQFDAVIATAKSAAANVDAAGASAEVALRDLDQRRAQLLAAQTRLREAQQNAPRQTAARQATVATREADIVSAKAVLDQAQLNLSYTKIYAPVGGVIANKTVEVGQRLQPGEQMFDISQIDDVWITANFKETQLRRIRPGQSVDVHVDALGVTLPGYVEDMPGATGAVTSLLPPENATGNYVKVVQRLPVRIRLKPNADPYHRLRIGMSVEPKVWLNSNTPAR